MFDLENLIFKLIKKNTICDEKILPIIELLDSSKKIYLHGSRIVKNNCNVLNNVTGKRGLYYFEVKRTSYKHNWTELNSSWGKISNSTLNGKDIKYKVSPIIKNRWDKHSYNDKDFFPFYIGKSLSSLNGRISEHVFSKTTKGYLESTGALRLQQHYKEYNIKDIMNCFIFRVSYVEINIEKELLELIESAIRSKKNCMVGKDC